MQKDSENGRRRRIARDGPSGVRHAAWAAGSDARKEGAEIGFIPLTDCASVVIASEMKFDEKHGIRSRRRKRHRGPVRDKLVNGELDARTCSMIDLRVHWDRWPEEDMALLCTLNKTVKRHTLQPASRQRRDRCRRSRN